MNENIKQMQKKLLTIINYEIAAKNDYKYTWSTIDFWFTTTSRPDVYAIISTLCDYSVTVH